MKPEILVNAVYNAVYRLDMGEHFGEIKKNHGSVFYLDNWVYLDRLVYVCKVNQK